MRHNFRTSELLFWALALTITYFLVAWTFYHIGYDEGVHTKGKFYIKTDTLINRNYYFKPD